MHRRNLSILLAYCLLNWFCIHFLLVSAEEDDDAQIPPTIVTSTSHEERDSSIEIPEDGLGPSETNGTYSEDGYGLHDTKEGLSEESIRSDSQEAIDTIEKNVVNGPQVPMEEYVGHVTPEITDEIQKNEYENAEDSSSIESDTTAMLGDSDEERTDKDNSQTERKEGDDHDATTVDGSYEMENETIAHADQESEERNGAMELNDEVDIAAGDSPESLESSVGNEIVTDMDSNVDDVANEDEDSPEPDDSAIDEIVDEMSNEDDVAVEDSPETVDSVSTLIVNEMGNANIDVDDAADEDVDAANDEMVNDMDNVDLNDDDVVMNSSSSEDTSDQGSSTIDEHASNPESIETTENFGNDYRDEVAFDEEQVEAELVGPAEPIMDAAHDNIQESSSSPVDQMGSLNDVHDHDTAEDLDGYANTSPEMFNSDEYTQEEIHEGIEDSSDRPTAVGSTSPEEQSSESIVDLDVEGGRGATADGCLDTQILDDSNEPTRMNHGEENSKDYANDGTKRPSYQGLWGTPMLGARPPDMELLYLVFESRIQKQLGIGPIPESELRQNLFPLGIGSDEDAAIADNAAKDANDSSSGSQADVNYDFVEGLDDIDKFFEGVDPPDELDVGASGSSMQDMLMKKGKEILIKRFRKGVGLVRKGLTVARGKISARLSELQNKDINVQGIARTVWSRTTNAYEALVDFVDGVLDFGSSNEEAEDFEAFKKTTMEELQLEGFTPER